VSKLDIAEKVVIQWWIGELENWLWDIMSRGLDWNIIVFLEVNTGLLLCWVGVSDTKEFALNTWVCWSSNVLAVSPLPITTSTGDATCSSAAAAGSWVSICFWVEAAAAALIPSTASWWTSSARCEFWSAGPIATWTWSIGSITVGTVSMLVIFTKGQN
jgi:hypothetical protein